jgi:hypothetical protein
MRFGLHPVYLLIVIGLLVILVGAALSIGWGFRNGWESAGRSRAGRTDVPPEP